MPEPTPDPFIDSLAEKTAAELKAIGLKFLRTRCLAVLSSDSGKSLNANAFRSLMVTLPGTFGFSAFQPDSQFVDVVVDKWFDYMKIHVWSFQDEDYLTYAERYRGYGNHYVRATDGGSIGKVLEKVRFITSIVSSFGSYIDKSNWLHSNYGYDRDSIAHNRLDRMLRSLGALYEYCCKWGYANDIRAADGSVGLPAGGDVAFRTMYDECNRLQAVVLKYLHSRDFAAEIEKRPVEGSSCSHFLIQVFGRLNQIIVIISPFDVRSSAEMWKCILKLVSDHKREVTHHKYCTKLLDTLHSEILKTLSAENLKATKDVERLLKLASFYAKIMLRIYKTIGTGSNNGDNHFNEYVHLLLTLKANLRNFMDPKVADFLGILNEMLPFVYGNGWSDDLKLGAGDYMSRLELYMNILSLLMDETNPEIRQKYALYGFLVVPIGDDLLRMSLDTVTDSKALLTPDIYRQFVIRIASLAVLVADNIDCYHMNQLDHFMFIAIAGKSAYGMLAYDVWRLRCSFMSPTQQLYYLKAFWCRLVGRSIQCQRPDTVFCRALARSFYDALPVEMQNQFLDDMDHDSIVFGGAITIDDLPITRLGDYDSKQLKTYNESVAAFASKSTQRNLHCMEIARHSLVKSRSEPAIEVLSDCCANLHVSMPNVFSTELHFVLDYSASLGPSQVVRVLEALTTHFCARNETLRSQNSSRWPCMDTLIRMQTVDFLRYVATSMDWTQMDSDASERSVHIVAELYRELLMNTASKADNVIRLHCMRDFVEVGPRVRHEQLILRTLRIGGGQLKHEVARALRKERVAAVAGDCADSVNIDRSMGVLRFKHICEGRYDQQIDEAVENMKSTARILRKLSQNGLLTNKQQSEVDCCIRGYNDRNYF